MASASTCWQNCFSSRSCIGDVGFILQRSHAVPSTVHFPMLCCMLHLQQGTPTCQRGRSAGRWTCAACLTTTRPARSGPFSSEWLRVFISSGPCIARNNRGSGAACSDRTLLTLARLPLQCEGSVVKTDVSQAPSSEQPLTPSIVHCFPTQAAAALPQHCEGGLRVRPHSQGPCAPQHRAPQGHRGLAGARPHCRWVWLLSVPHKVSLCRAVALRVLLFWGMDKGLAMRGEEAGDKMAPCLCRAARGGSQGGQQSRTNCHNQPTPCRPHVR